MKLFSTIILTFVSTIVYSQSLSQNVNVVFPHLNKIDQQVIPADTAVRRGVLSNGLTYYVLRNTNPEKRVFFSLLMKGGSVLEKDNERGLAHFVEHMMFKGTKHFPGNDVKTFMLHNGIRFGYDSNAFTQFNSVRYFLNNISSDSEQTLDSCLLLLRDWCTDATFADRDIESERNVIMEEWRVRNGSAITTEVLNDLFNHSVYAHRSPIGDTTIIRNCSPQLVRSFYQRWYQPQNLAVVVVGDIDADQMVAKVEKMFGNMKRGKNIAQLPPAVPDYGSLQYRTYHDSLASFGSVCLSFKLPALSAQAKKTIGGQRSLVLRDEIKRLSEDILKERIKGDKQIYSCFPIMLEFVDYKAPFMMLQLNCAPDHWKQALELLVSQMEQFRRKGFGEYEVEENYFSAYNADSSAIYFNNLPDFSQGSSELVQRITKNFYTGETIFSPKVKLGVDAHVKRTITPEQLCDEFRKIYDDRNIILGLSLPQALTPSYTDEMQKVVNRVRNLSDDELSGMAARKAEKLKSLKADSIFFATVPGTVRQTTVVNDSTTELLLSNGVRVALIKDTVKSDFKHVDFSFRRPSGFSVLGDDDIYYQSALSSCVRKYELNNSSFQQYTLPFSDDCKAWAHVLYSRNLEDYLKVIYASLTTTEVDSVAFLEWQKNLTAQVAAMNPFILSNFKVANLPLISTKRMMPATAEQAAALNIDRFREILSDYHSNYNGSMLVMKGSFDTDSLMPYVLQYIGALPSKAEPVKRIGWPSDHFKTADSHLVEKIEAPAPISHTYVHYAWEEGFQYTPSSNAHNQVLQFVFGELLFRVLRQQHGDVYTPQCFVTTNQYPFPRMLCSMFFSCAPDHRERILQDVTTIMHDMAYGDLITQELIDGSIKAIEKTDPFLSLIAKGAPQNEYLDQALDGVVVKANDVEMMKKVTPASLKAHLQQLLEKGNVHIGCLTTEE